MTHLLIALVIAVVLRSSSTTAQVRIAQYSTYASSICNPNFLDSRALLEFDACTGLSNGNSFKVNEGGNMNVYEGTGCDDDDFVGTVNSGCTASGSRSVGLSYIEVPDAFVVDIDTSCGSDTPYNHYVSIEECSRLSSSSSHRTTKIDNDTYLYEEWTTNDRCYRDANINVTLTNTECTDVEINGNSIAITMTRLEPNPSSGPCFHQDTIIEQDGKQFTLHDLLNDPNPSCTIPHVLESSDGVAINATCGGVNRPSLLKLTKDHLVYTQRGLVPAGELRPFEDVLYEDVDEKTPCEIRAVVSESGKKQQYFGLNCLNSVVLANGLKTSTFATMHGLPSWWMGVFGRIAGIKTASAVGDFVTKMAVKTGLISF